MIFDFTASASKPHDLESALQLIAELWINGAQLTAELTALKEKLNTNPINSSLPPSTDVFAKHKKKIKLQRGVAIFAKAFLGVHAQKCGKKLRDR